MPSVGGAVLVLGAGVYGDGEPTSILEGRLRTALELYQSGKVRWFLVSGDNRHSTYNEPQAMRRWLIKQGVPLTNIVSDYAGLRTWDSLKRAQAVFGLRQVVVESLAKPELTLIVARRNCLLAAGSIKAYERAIAPGGELEKCV